MLMGLQVALLGVAFGMGVSLLVLRGLGSVMESMLPMPVFRTSFQTGEFLQPRSSDCSSPSRDAVAGVARRSRPSRRCAAHAHLAAKGGSLSPMLKRLTAQGTNLNLMPVRNIVRAPGRMVLTAVGLGAAICMTVGVIGAIDSFNATIDIGVQEVRSGAPDRIEVNLANIVPVSKGAVPAVATAPYVQAAAPSLRMGGRLLGAAGTAQIDAVLELIELQNPGGRDRDAACSLGERPSRGRRPRAPRLDGEISVVSTSSTSPSGSACSPIGPYEAGPSAVGGRPALREAEDG
jgi:putative ABC transport system permease protein